MDYMVIGEIIKAQGIRGELKIKPLTDDASRFKRLKVIYLDEKAFKIQSCRTDTFVYLKLESIDSRNIAEQYVGKQVSIDRINSIPLENDSYFIVDLIGCILSDEQGAEIGVITDIDSFGAADVITVKDSEGKILRFPFLNRITDSVDVGAKVMRVKRKEFEGVCVYED